MAVSRPDGLPLYENYRDYNFNEKSPFISDDTDTPVAFSSYQHDDVDIHVAFYTCDLHTPHTCATGDAQFHRAHYGSPANLMAKTIYKTRTTSGRVVVTRFTSAYVHSDWNGLGAGSSSWKNQ